MKSRFVLFILLFVLASFSVMAAEEPTKDDLRCLPCGDGCVSAEDIATMFCTPSTRDFECGVENRECVAHFEDSGDVTVCHFPPGTLVGNEIKISEHAVDAHLSHGDYFGECEDEIDIDIDVHLGDGGVNSGVRGKIDRFFDGIFQDNLENMQERFAEIRTLVKEGEVEDAKELLDDYRKFADELEKEVSPAQKKDAVKLSKMVRKAIREMEDKLSEEDRIEFKKEIQRKAHNVGKAAEIAEKISELCAELSELDPGLFYENCKTEDDGPKWHEEMFEDLSDSQRKEAEKFAKIMKQCFSTSGQNCACDEIPYDDFAKACSQAAPLAVACDIEGDEAACGKLDSLDMPELPPHLQDVFDELEDINEEKFDLHMPPECVKAGAKSPKECGKVMVQLHAPEECRDALLAAEPTSEREGREICDKIMMKIHAPECAEKGITDQRECRKFMESSFRMDDHRGPDGPRINFNCRDISDPDKRLECFDRAASQVESHRGFHSEEYDGPCMTEQDWRAKKQECRDLYGEHAGDEPIMGDSGDGYECPIDAKCIDFGQFKDDDYNMRWEEIKEKERMCAVQCESEGKPWDFSNGVCVCKDVDYYPRHGPDDGDWRKKERQCASRCESEGKYWDFRDGNCICKEGDYYPRDGPEYGDDDWEESECKDGCHQECGDQNTDCREGRCVCLGYGENGPPPSDDDSGDREYDDSDPEDYEGHPDEGDYDQGGQPDDSNNGGDDSHSDDGHNGDQEQPEQNQPEPSPEPEPQPEPEEPEPQPEPEPEPEPEEAPNEGGEE